MTLLKHLAKSDNANVFVSPVSIDQAMQLVAAGTEGESRKEIASAFSSEEMTAEQMGDEVTSLNQSLSNADPGVQIDIANALWSDKEWPLSDSYQKLCLTSFQAKAQTLDFSSAAAANAINDWVSSKTHGKIDTIISPSGLPHPGAVITNAVYFHGSWSTPFNSESTSDGPFTVESGGAITFPMMHRVDQFAYMQTDQLQAISLPYGKSGRLEMLIVLPRTGATLESIVQGQSDDSLENMRSSMIDQRVQLALPRFHITYSTELIPPLKEMGIYRPFEPSADFRPMGFPRGYISAIIHKTTLDVNEEGTVATAAIGITMRSMAVAAVRTIMNVDHPFLCIIRDTRSKALLFVGAIYAPQPLKS